MKRNGDSDLLLVNKIKSYLCKNDTHKALFSAHYRSLSWTRVQEVPPQVRLSQKAAPNELLVAASIHYSLLQIWKIYNYYSYQKFKEFRIPP